MNTTMQDEWRPSWFETTIANTPAHITGLVVLLFVACSFLFTGLVLVWSSTATPSIEVATQQNQLVYQVQTGRIVMTVTRLAAGNVATSVVHPSAFRENSAPPVPQYTAQTQVRLAAR